MQKRNWKWNQPQHLCSHSKQRNQTHLNQSKTSYTWFVIFSFNPFVGDNYSGDLKKADGYFDQKTVGVTLTSEWDKFWMSFAFWNNFEGCGRVRSKLHRRERDRPPCPLSDAPHHRFAATAWLKPALRSHHSCSHGCTTDDHMSN